MKRRQTLSPPKITVAICTYDRYELLARAIESLVAQSLPKARYRILVVDNTPGASRTRARAWRDLPNLRYIVEKRPGLSNARNVAARVCGTELIAFMDDDAVADPAWVKQILAAFAAFGRKTAIVGGRVDPIWGAPRPPWLDDGLLGHVSVIDWGGAARVAQPHEWFAGTNITFRTRTVLDHGGFSPQLGRFGSGTALLGNEEVDLIARIRTAGGVLVYAPDAIVGHQVDASRLTRTWFRKRAAWQAVSDFLMDPQRFAHLGSKLWNDTLHYFNALPPHERGMRGLLLDTDDPGLFRWQTSAIYMLTMLSLGGFAGAGEDTLR